VQVGNAAYIDHRLYHAVDIGPQGNFNTGLAGGPPELLLVKTGFSNGRLDAAGAVVHTISAIGKTTGPANMGKGGHDGCRPFAAQPVLRLYPLQDASLVTQTVIGEAFKDKGDLQVGRVQGVFKY